MKKYGKIDIVGNLNFQQYDGVLKTIYASSITSDIGMKNGDEVEVEAELVKEFGLKYYKGKVLRIISSKVQREEWRKKFRKHLRDYAKSIGILDTDAFPIAHDVDNDLEGLRLLPLSEAAKIAIHRLDEVASRMAALPDSHISNGMREEEDYRNYQFGCVCVSNGNGYRWMYYRKSVLSKKEAFSSFLGWEEIERPGSVMIGQGSFDSSYQYYGYHIR